MDLRREPLINGWDVLLCDLSQLRRLSLRFRSRADLKRAVSKFPRTLPRVHSLEISGEFDIPELPWPGLPALKHLTMRKDSPRPLDLVGLSSFVLPAAPFLETLTLISMFGFAVSPHPPAPYPPCSASSLVLRGSPTRNLAYKDLISILRCEGVPHMALQSSRLGVGVPLLAQWTPSAFESVELCLYRPPQMRPEYGDNAVARFQDVDGRSRTCILVQRPRVFLAHPSIASITRLSLDESDFNPDEFPQTALLPALASLEIRLVEGGNDARRLFVPAGAEGGLMRITLWAERCRGVWRFTALQHLEFACVPRSRPVRVTCGDLVYLLDRLCAPVSVQLSLRNLGVHDPPTSQEYALLRSRVSQLTIEPDYRPHAVERDWALWGMAGDRNL
ncbi:hypothetical protein AURDEDRAFT_161562 [Auricularia subglabra TFB-10046 SS5]|nr:hypothetical protein AURDEDRAFT_161562 [Auricularia subglabra TFB-10046 SS5]